MNREGSGDWHSLRDPILGAISAHSARWQPLLDLFAESRATVEILLGHPSGIDTDRPQDYVTAVLVARIYRVTTGGVLLATAGYPDLVPNLSRSIWEVGVRLLDIARNPIPAAFGYLLKGVEDEIAAIESEIARRTADDALTGQIGSNLAKRREYLENLKALACARGLDTSVIVGRHGKLNVRRILEANDAGSAYQVDYRFLSGFAHDSPWSFDDLLIENEESRSVNLGICPDGGVEATVDTLSYFFSVLSVASVIMDDSVARRNVDLLLSELDARYARLRVT